jgi:CDP-glycerol glycerophosphotransferase (TagB/SpsB family)
LSSVGYDFLTFNRPMFFFNPTQRDSSDQGLYLHQCGSTLEPDQIFHALNDDQSHLASLREQTYGYTFGKKRNWDLIQAEVLEALVL